MVGGGVNDKAAGWIQIDPSLAGALSALFPSGSFQEWQSPWCSASSYLSPNLLFSVSWMCPSPSLETSTPVWVLGLNPLSHASLALNCLWFWKHRVVAGPRSRNRPVHRGARSMASTPAPERFKTPQTCSQRKDFGFWRPLDAPLAERQPCFFLTRFWNWANAPSFTLLPSYKSHCNVTCSKHTGCHGGG